MDIEKSLELSSKATPGPWEWSCGRNEDAIVTESVPYPSEDQVRYGGHPIADEFSDADGNFVIDARENFPELLKRFKRLRELLGSMSWASGNCELSLAAYLEIQQLLSLDGKDGA